MLCYSVVAVATPPSPSLEFELSTLDGTRFFQLSDQKDKTLVINFWDTECPPCVREMPLLDRTARQHPDVVFIGVSVSPRDAARLYLDNHPVSYQQLLAPADPRSLLRRFGDQPGALPHTVILRKDKTLCRSKTGEVDADWLEAALTSCQ